MTPALLAVPLAALLARKRLLIFDLDGTLINSSPLHAQAFTEACAPLGIAVDYATIAGMTTETAVDQLADAAGVSLMPEARQALIARKRHRALTLIETELEAMPGAPLFLQKTGSRWQRALCTSASRANADAALRRTGMGACFDWIITANDVVHGKPDPEIFRLALNRAGIPAEHALVFEDAPSGLAAAAAAGIDVIEIVRNDAPTGTNQANWSMLNDVLGAEA